MPILTLPLSPERLALLMSLAADESDYQRDLIKARDYHVGAQFVALTERLREFLGGDTGDTSQDANRLRVNVTRIITTAVTERILVSGFDSNEQGVAQPVLDETGAPKTDADGAPLTETVKPIAAWAWQVWQANRMDAKQARVHIATCRDSESFVIVDWDNAARRPRFTPHLRFVDQSVTSSTGADVGEGCRAFYQNDDEDQQLLYVTKRWTEVFTAGGQRQQRQRLTIYYPDRIEKYSGFSGAWQAFRDEGDTAWPIPWVDRAGAPLGIPVAHFRSSAGMEAREAWPAQNAINYLAVLELTAADMTAFRILVAIGWNPVNAAGAPLTIAPGTWVGTVNKDGKVQDIPPADIAPISNLIEGWVFRAAMVTDTPISRFITTKAVSAEGTQKQQDGPLVNKVRNRQGELGNGWEDCMRIGVRLANTFGAGDLDEMALIYAKWEPAEARDEGAQLDAAVKKQDLGVPVEQVWAELGYSQEKIAQWQKTQEGETFWSTAKAARDAGYPLELYLRDAGWEQARIDAYLASPERQAHNALVRASLALQGTNDPTRNNDSAGTTGQ